MTVLADKPALYTRLPEVYQQYDFEQVPPYQLRALVDSIDSVLQALAARIGVQYDDLFIETCDDWVIPYLADLVGASHLSGEAWTLRADVARTVKNRRRKGTLGAVESQVHTLSGWAVHATELRANLAWNQPLNHLRPDVGGGSPFKRPPPQNDIHTPVRGGTANLRSPAVLAFVDKPFDQFAHTVDVKPPLFQTNPLVARTALNLPNLGVFLWRLADYRTPASRPCPPRAPRKQIEAVAAGPGNANFVVRFELHPQGEPMVLFNSHRFRADSEPPNLAYIDEVPNPMPNSRLNSDDRLGRPEEYVRVSTYTSWPNPPAPDAPGLLLHLPAATFVGNASANAGWKFRGADLCAWESQLAPPLRAMEVVIDPKHGRVVFGVPGATQAEFAKPLANGLLVSATTGFSGAKRVDGSVGAQPVPRTFAKFDPDHEILKPVDGTKTTLADALANLGTLDKRLIVEIVNSDTYVLDLGAIAGIGDDTGILSLRLPTPVAVTPKPDDKGPPFQLTIRAKTGERPVIRLVQPLRIRPATITKDDALQTLHNVRLQGLYVTRDATFPAQEALIEQAAVNRIEIDGCTLDPGGAIALDGTRAPMRDAMGLTDDLGLSTADRDAFNQTPEVVLTHTLCGALAIDARYNVGLASCIVDAGAGVTEAAPGLAIGAATGDAEKTWSAPIAFRGVTVFGRTRVEQARGEGAIFVHRLEVHDNQDSHTGPLRAVRGVTDENDVLSELAKSGSCIRSSWFEGNGDRLPQHFMCVFGTDAPLRFTAESFGNAGYAQLSLDADRRIREEGPDADEMGAFGFLRNTHKWKNIDIRLREFMPVGFRALLIPVT